MRPAQRLAGSTLAALCVLFHTCHGEGRRDAPLAFIRTSGAGARGRLRDVCVTCPSARRPRALGPPLHVRCAGHGERVFTANDIADMLAGRSEPKPGKGKQQAASTTVDRRLRKRAVDAEAQDAAAAATAMPESRALLGDVRVVLIGTKMPVTIGMVARACGSFEVGSLVLVAPRTNPLQRSALRASKGALQHSLSAGKLRWIVADSLEEALEGSSHAVAMTRLDTPEDLGSESPPTAGQDDAAAGTLGGPDEAREGAIWARLQRKQMEGLRGLSRFLSSVRQQAHEERRGTLTLIFGREDAGFEQAELDRDEVVGICSIPMSCRFGTESLSLSQAVPIVLARLYEDSQQPPPPGMPSPGR